MYYLLEMDFRWRISMVVCAFSELDSNFIIPSKREESFESIATDFSFFKKKKNF